MCWLNDVNTMNYHIIQSPAANCFILTGLTGHSLLMADPSEGPQPDHGTGRWALLDTDLLDRWGGLNCWRLLMIPEMGKHQICGCQVKVHLLPERHPLPAMIPCGSCFLQGPCMQVLQIIQDASRLCPQVPDPQIGVIWRPQRSQKFPKVPH